MQPEFYLPGFSSADAKWLSSGKHSLVFSVMESAPLLPKLVLIDKQHKCRLEAKAGA